MQASHGVSATHIQLNRLRVFIIGFEESVLLGHEWHFDLGQTLLGIKKMVKSIVNIALLLK